MTEEVSMRRGDWYHVVGGEHKGKRVVFTGRVMAKPTKDGYRDNPVMKESKNGPELVIDFDNLRRVPCGIRK